MPKPYHSIGIRPCLGQHGAGVAQTVKVLRNFRFVFALADQPARRVG
jgi:hypothetical protein